MFKGRGRFPSSTGDFGLASVTLLAGIVGITVSTVGVRRLVLKCREEQNKPTTAQNASIPESRKIRYVQLNEDEQKLALFRMAPINTVTWFATGKNPDAHEEVARIIQDRLERIVQANPWLRGRIVKQNDGIFYLEYTSDPMSEENEETPSSTSPSKPSLVQEHTGQKLFTHETKPPVGFRPDTKDQPDACKPFLLQRNEFLNEPVLKVSVVPGYEGHEGGNGYRPLPYSTFALIVSMSHIIADGYTFYTIHNMLTGGDTEIRPLQSERIPGSLEQQANLIGKTEKNLNASIPFFISAVRGLLYQAISELLIGKESIRPCPLYFLVDEMKMKQLKQDATEEDPKISFCSSNDVIVSWFFRSCQAAYAFMAINFRNRLPGHTNEHAGNYSTGLYYNPAVDGATPGLIRQSITNMKRVVTVDTLPTALYLAFFGTTAICSNWASFHADQVDFPIATTECKQLMHLPLFDPVPPTLSLCVIFRLRPKELAVCVVAAPNQMERFQNIPFKAQGNPGGEELANVLSLD